MNQTQKGKEDYKQLVEEVSPNSPILTNCIKAFIVGGLICVLGQFIINIIIGYGIEKELAGTYTTVILVLAGVILTGFGIYDKLGKFAGAGSIVPVTGFANAVAAPTIEFKKEGLVLGLGAKMFIVAGPVILYGVLSSVLVGIIYYFLK
ncbi:MAG: stage V sporulation protein AC [Defluviitaleaceae bacterium]|nr:stage V sporulation protein AC [Defluviitaleaceae bacterium]